jgi:Fe-S cluster biogenesis protein NfuA/nitrite reductase/ring-hydroxylating ferredoxin subunit
MRRAIKVPDELAGGAQASPREAADTQRRGLAAMVGDLEALEVVLGGWDEGARNTVQAYRRALEALHAEAFRRLICLLKEDPAAFAVMRRAVNDEVVHAVLRHLELVKPSVNERAEAALASVRPLLAAHGGDVQVVKVEPPTIELRLTGTCDGCASSALTFQAGIRKAVAEACPEITHIVHVQAHTPRTDTAGLVSPFAALAAPRAEADGWLAAATLDDIPEGGIHAITIGAERLILFRRGAIVNCFRDACAHLGRRIHDGELKDGILTCSHHGFRYELATGKCLTAPDLELDSIAVRIIGKQIEVRRAD